MLRQKEVLTMAWPKIEIVNDSGERLFVIAIYC
jgi:hypothetical protein